MNQAKIQYLIDDPLNQAYTIALAPLAYDPDDQNEPHLPNNMRDDA